MSDSRCRDSPDVLARISAAAPNGLDAVADIAGGPELATMMPLLRDNGRWVLADAVTGPVVGCDFPPPNIGVPRFRRFTKHAHPGTGNGQ